MSKVIRAQKPSVLPWYAAALVFAVLCAALPAYKLWALLLALGGAAVMFGVAKKVCPPRVVEHEVPFHTGSGDVDEMLAEDPTLNGSELHFDSLELGRGERFSRAYAQRPLSLNAYPLDAREIGRAHV